MTSRFLTRFRHSAGTPSLLALIVSVKMLVDGKKILLHLVVLSTKFYQFKFCGSVFKKRDLTGKRSQAQTKNKKRPIFQSPSKPFSRNIIIYAMRLVVCQTACEKATSCFPFFRSIKHFCKNLTKPL